MPLQWTVFFRRLSLTNDPGPSLCSSQVGSRHVTGENLQLRALQSLFSAPLGQVGDKIYYTGASETIANGDKLIYGQQGEVRGAGRGKWVGRVSVLFPGNTGNINCTVDELSKDPPGPLPGGFEAM